MPEQPINKIVHPSYKSSKELWKAYRSVGEGGEAFLEDYLEQRTKEKAPEFELRKRITYIPAFAKSAMNKVQNSVAQRMSLIKRLGGSTEYRGAVFGYTGGVDRAGTTLTRFMNDKPLTELTMMGGVGIYVDAPAERGPTVADEVGKTPYLYIYKVEDIRAWTMDPSNPKRFTALLLRDNIDSINEDYGLATKTVNQYRLYRRDETSGQVTLELFDQDGEPKGNSVTLGITEIPFIYLKLPSLLVDIYRHQIALLNLGSSDMKYAFDGNITFLAEKYDPNDMSEFFSKDGGEDSGTETSERDHKAREKFLGDNVGVRVPQNIDYPEFIHPSSEPLKASMAKELELKEEIVQLINQNLRTLASKSVQGSTETRKLDSRAEEDGLKVIGDTLESGENRINLFWAMYEGSKEPALSIYPNDYSFQTNESRRAESTQLLELISSVPSTIGQKEIAKRIAYLLLDDTVPQKTLEVVYKEIDGAHGIISNPDQLASLVEAGLVSSETATQQLGFDKSEAKKAQSEKVERAKLIQEAQGGGGDQSFNAGARGAKDISADPKGEAKAEKKTLREKGKKT